MAGHAKPRRKRRKDRPPWPRCVFVLKSGEPCNHATLLRDSAFCLCHFTARVDELVEELREAESRQVSLRVPDLAPVDVESAYAPERLLALGRILVDMNLRALKVEL